MAPKPEQAAGNHIQFLKRNPNIENLMIIGSQPIYIGNHRLAQNLEYTYADQMGNNMVGYDIFFNKLAIIPSEYLFNIHFAGEAAKFNTYLPILAHMANSFNEYCS
jgi:hypothetical protein